LPVILVLPGVPGDAGSVMTLMNLPTTMTALIQSGAAKPAILVSADTSIGGKNWDCADVPGGAAVTTWLSQDVRSLIESHFHVLGAAHRWTALGLSSGGNCAVRLALTRPASFAAAASLSGSDAPESRALTGSSASIQANDLRTLAAAGASPPVSLLLAASREDPGTVADATSLQSAATSHGIKADLEVISHGGHTWTTWQRMAGPALTWLGQHRDS
jgi:enterochelin esterase-like enzyme